LTGIHFLDAKGPDGARLYAIGDVHGRPDLLAEMHARIRAEIIRDRPRDWRIIHLGDYVDRGPDSKGVLDLLVAAREADRRVVTLAGNHDVGFLEFLAHPSPKGLFALFGGPETARSYSVELDLTDPRRFREGSEALVRAIPPAHVALLRTLEFSCTFGDFFFCHAGIRPGVPLDEQDRMDLIWIRDTFLHWPHLHPKVVVHGHTPSPDPEIMPNRVNIDTGAYKMGRLTALVIDGAEKRLLSVSE
jgi:serine/threonine protein phosphatase 1